MPRHVVYLNPSGQLGGAETSLLELLRAAMQSGAASRATLILGQDGPFARNAAASGADVRVLPMPDSLSKAGDSTSKGVGLIRLVRTLSQSAVGASIYLTRLRGILRELQPDLIHSTGFKMHVLGAWARDSGTPLLWHIHDYLTPRPLMRRLVSLHARQCNAAAANSESVAQEVRAACPDTPVHVLYNAVDLDRFHPPRPGEPSGIDLDSLAGLPIAQAGTVRVGLPATFAHWKGHRTFLEALARLDPSSGVRGYIIGGPIYQTGGSQLSPSDLRMEIHRLGLDGRAGLTGFLPDPANALRALDIVVHASTAPEPFGMVIAEAMACGRAVIASRAGGALEIFEEESNALAHTPGDAADLARQIARLASSPELRFRLGAAGRRAIEESFHRGRLALTLGSIYEAVARSVRN